MVCISNNFMKKNVKTFLKFAAKDEIAKSANPSIVRASTIYFRTMQEMRKHQKNIAKGKKVSHWDYGRQGSQTTIHLQNILGMGNAVLRNFCRSRETWCCYSSYI